MGVEPSIEMTMYHNNGFVLVELEMVKDKKERVTPRLWTKLIQSLCECEPQALRGHYGSLADLVRCSR